MFKVSGRDLKNKKKIKYAFDMPSKWEELNAEQTANILLLLTFTKADVYTLNVSILLILVGNKHFHTLSKMDMEDVHALAGLVSWVFKTRPPAINKFPKLKINKTICIAPKDSLDNICFGEWCFAYEFYKLFGKTSSDIYLDKLIATLYRPVIENITVQDENYKGDLRQPFNENLIDLRAKALGRQKKENKLAIIAWFTSALLEQMDKRSHVFPKDDPNIPEKVTENEEEDYRTWLTVFRELTGPKFGTAEQLKFTNAMYVLDHLEEQNIAYEEAKRAMKS